MVMVKEKRVRTRLKEERKKKRLTQENVAEILGTTRGYYVLIENGNRDPGFQLAKKISLFFGMDLREWS